MNIPRFKLFLRRWSISFENHTATRREPNGVNSRYSLRTPITHKFADGSKIILKSNHRLLWNTLLLFAHDLTVTPAKTLVGREALSLETGLSADMIGDCLDDLEELGWIRRQKRKGTSNLTSLYLTPIEDQDNLPAEVPVSVAEEDIGAYVCQAAKSWTGVISKDSLPEHFDALMGLVTAILSDHPFLKRKDATRLLTASLLKCVRAAGSVHHCHVVLHSILWPSLEKMLPVFTAIERAKNLALHIEQQFPTWLAMYTPETSETATA